MEGGLGWGRGGWGRRTERAGTQSSLGAASVSACRRVGKTVVLEWDEVQFMKKRRVRNEPQGRWGCWAVSHACLEGARAGRLTPRVGAAASWLPPQRGQSRPALLLTSCCAAAARLCTSHCRRCCRWPAPAASAPAAGAASAWPQPSRCCCRCRTGCRGQRSQRCHRRQSTRPRRLRWRRGWRGSKVPRRAAEGLASSDTAAAQQSPCSLAWAA